MRPHDQDSALLQNSSRENAQGAALSVLCAKSEHACESLRFACSSGDLRWVIDERNNDGDGDGREKARTADGGTFARLCVRGRRKVCRARLENILDVQRRSDTTFPIRTVHSTCMYSNATSASAQLPCNITVQHVQVCREMRWPRPSHDSWPRLPPTKSWVGSRYTFVRTVEIDGQNHRMLMRAACLLQASVRVHYQDSFRVRLFVNWFHSVNGCLNSTRLSCAHLHRTCRSPNIFSKDEQKPLSWRFFERTHTWNANGAHPWVFVQGIKRQATKAAVSSLGSTSSVQMRRAKEAKTSHRSSEWDLKLEHRQHHPSALRPEGPAAPLILKAARRIVDPVKESKRTGWTSAGSHEGSKWARAASVRSAAGGCFAASTSFTVDEDPGEDGAFRSNTPPLLSSDSMMHQEDTWLHSTCQQKRGWQRCDENFLRLNHCGSLVLPNGSRVSTRQSDPLSTAADTSRGNAYGLLHGKTSAVSVTGGLEAPSRLLKQLFPDRCVLQKLDRGLAETAREQRPSPLFQRAQG